MLGLKPELWVHFPLLGSIPSLWWVLDQWGLSLEPLQAVWRTAGRGKQRFMELLFVFPAGSPYYDNVRPLSYPDSDAVLICFDISRPETLDSVLKKASVGASPEHRALLDKLILKSLQWCCSCPGNFHFVSVNGAMTGGCFNLRSFVWKGWMLIENKNWLLDTWSRRKFSFLSPETARNCWGWCEVL